MVVVVVVVVGTHRIGVGPSTTADRGGGGRGQRLQ
jgi:hypothetical protein